MWYTEKSELRRSMENYLKYLRENNKDKEDTSTAIEQYYLYRYRNKTDGVGKSDHFMDTSKYLNPWQLRHKQKNNYEFKAHTINNIDFNRIADDLSKDTPIIMAKFGTLTFFVITARIVEKAKSIGMLNDITPATGMVDLYRTDNKKAYVASYRIPNKEWVMKKDIVNGYKKVYNAKWGHKAQTVKVIPITV